MPFWEIVNTEVKLAGPMGNSLEAMFGQAALTLLEAGDSNALDELMKLRKQAREIMKKVDKLTDKHTKK